MNPVCLLRGHDFKHGRTKLGKDPVKRRLYAIQLCDRCGRWRVFYESSTHWDDWLLGRT